MDTILDMLDIIFLDYWDDLVGCLKTVLTDTNLQPFILIPTGFGVLGAIIGQAKRVVRIGSGRRR